MASIDSSVMQPISIVLIDMPAITSDLLQRAFARLPGYEVVGCTTKIDEATRLVGSQHPDVAIVYSSETNGSFTAISWLDRFLCLDSSVRAVVISTHLTNIEAAAYLRAHACGVLSARDAYFEVLCRCLTCVRAGQIWANSEHLACLVETLSLPKYLRIVNQKNELILSRREDEVLQLLSTGMSNRELAKALSLSEHTIKNHVFHIFDKLGVSSRMEAVLYATNHQEDCGQFPRSGASIEKVSSDQGTEAGWHILNARGA